MPQMADENKTFYASLMRGEVKRGLLGPEKRFNARSVIRKEGIKRYFTDVVSPLLGTDMQVLDLGCGTGAFTLAMAPLCRKVVAVDIVPEFTAETARVVAENNLGNVEVIYQSGPAIPCPDHSFDAVVLVDVIHHIHKLEETLAEAMRVLKPAGRIIIFEPNKLNPMMYALHMLDRNEWGLLKLGRPGVYQKRLKPFMDIQNIRFSGLVIGPDSPVFLKIADFLNKPSVYPWLGWLLPKIHIYATKKG